MSPALLASLIALQSPLTYEDAFDRDCARRLVERSAWRSVPMNIEVARIVARCSRPFRPALTDPAPHSVEREIYDVARGRFALDIMQQILARRERARTRVKHEPVEKPE